MISIRRRFGIYSYFVSIFFELFFLIILSLVKSRVLEFFR